MSTASQATLPNLPMAATRAHAVEGWFPALVRRTFVTVDRHVAAHPWRRHVLVLTVHALVLGVMFDLAYELRWDFSTPEELYRQRLLLLLPVVACKLLLLYSFGQFRSILSYFGLADFGGLLAATGLVSGLMLGFWLFAEVGASPPRGVILIDFVLSVAGLSALRLALRLTRTWSTTAAGPSLRRVAIIGADDAGEAIAKELMQKQGSGLLPVIFIDDDPRKIGHTIHGLPVYGPLEKLSRIGTRLQVQEVLVASSSTPPRRLQEIVGQARGFGAGTQIVPSVTQLATGEVKVERTRPVAIEDLLGRAAVNLEDEGVAHLVRDRVVLVTGAGGSIGSELCRQILRHGPRNLVMVDQAEIALFEIEQELAATTPVGCLRPLIVDVAEEPAVRELLWQHRPEVVFHAAAHKHVPIMERQPAEALKNNSFATAMFTRLAAEAGVAWFVFISTDKAINPTSVMGCSKRLAELALQARQRAPGNCTRFMAVRFGNVLGSSGSVIPVFRRQIAQGGPVTVTHPDMTRYFMTIPEAVGLVLQAATLGEGGEIFILDMGEPVKITDLARQMIELSGYKPDVDIEIKFTGLRPGEKLFEELRHNDETHETTEHPRIFKLRTVAAAPPSTWLDDLRATMSAGGDIEIKRAMKVVVPEYQPYHE